MATAITVDDNLEIQPVNPSSIIIPTKVADGLDGWKCDLVKEATANIRTSSVVMGKCIVSTAESLHRLKSLIPKSNWIAFLDSGMISIKRATALNLVKAWEVFLSRGVLTDGELANISAQSLGKIARANDPEVTKKVVAKLKAGERVPESQVDLMIKTAHALAEDLDDENSGATVAKLMEIVETTTNNNKNHKIQESSMVKKIGNLEARLLAETKKVKDLTDRNKELLAELDSLKRNMKTATAV